MGFQSNEDDGGTFPARSSTGPDGASARPCSVDREGSDAYQWLPLISTHEQRHVLQIREIKAHPKSPKK
jgi:hypothetical protein